MVKNMSLFIRKKKRTEQGYEYWEQTEEAEKKGHSMWTQLKELLKKLGVC